MGRTQLRGVELAGMRWAIEVPAEHPWRWPTSEFAPPHCDPIDPDVYVGVRVAEIDPPLLAGIAHAFEGGSFDVARDGEDWLVVVRDRLDRAVRLARFDASFGIGEVIVAPGSARPIEQPLAAPLLDVILQQRVVRAGGLMVAGRAIVRGGGALAVIGSDPAPSRSDGSTAERGGARAAVDGPHARLVLRPHEDGVRVWAMTHSQGYDRLSGPARVDAVHVVQPSQTVYARRACPDSAMTSVLEHVYAPVHDDDNTDRLFDAADRLVSRVPVLELGLPSEKRAAPFAWGGRDARVAPALPGLA